MSRHREINKDPGDDAHSGRSDWELPAELKSIEAKLAALMPRDDRLDREHLAFLAGQASVKERRGRQEVFGLRLNERVWARAFAVMTVVATLLLAMLITRPAVVQPISGMADDVASSGQRQEPAPRDNSTGLANRTDLLSTGDAYSNGIEQLLANHDVVNLPIVPAPPSSNDERDRPALTPTSWRQFFDDFDAADPTKRDSSNFHELRELNS